MQKGFSPILIIVLVVIVAVLVGGAFYLGTRMNNNPVTTSLSPTPIPQVSAKVQPTDSQWRKYEDQSLGFSFEYPKDWYVFVHNREEQEIGIYISAKPESESENYMGLEDYDLIEIYIRQDGLPTSVITGNGGVYVPVVMSTKYASDSGYDIYTAETDDGYVAIKFGNAEYVSFGIGGYQNQKMVEGVFRKVIASFKKTN